MDDKIFITKDDGTEVEMTILLTYDKICVIMSL